MHTVAKKRKVLTKVTIKKANRKNCSEVEGGNDFWHLKLYVAGQTQKSIVAFANLTKLCDQYLASKYRIEVIDLLENPQLAKGDQIIALPTLVRKLPGPKRKIIGDLSNTEKVLVVLDIQPSKK